MTKSSRWWAVFLLVATVATVEIILLLKLLNSQTLIELILAIGVVTTLIVLTLRIEDVHNLSLIKDGLKAECNRHFHCSE